MRSNHHVVAGAPDRLFALSLLTIVCACAQDPTEILNRTRATVEAQLAKSANYTCVQAIERTYFTASQNLPHGCESSSKKPASKEFMRDRLRLDVAVSAGQEIYSWHGENKFSSSNVADVVRSGPISSGGFVGYLENIFLSPGIRFSYSGESIDRGVDVHKFSYVVPLDSTRYRVQTHEGMALIPFHGSFAVKAADYQLQSLEVIGDDIPSSADVCSAETDMTYQLANISGRVALLPSLFLLKIADESHIFTVSRNEYSQCREFRGESVLHFDVQDTPVTSGTLAPPAEEWLPGKVTLHIGLRTTINDETSYAGDAVEGTLLDAVKIQTGRVIPKGAVMHGMITQLELREQPWKQHLVSIQFNKVSFGNTSFQILARKKDSERPAAMYGRRGRGFGTLDPAYPGAFVFTSSHFHLDQHFSALWITQNPPESTTLAERGR